MFRTCPVEEANVAYIENGLTKVRIDNDKCIACGACLTACHHESRSFNDDTERFFDDLRHGVSISLFCAPAVRSNLKDWERVLTLLRKLGANKVYDVSMGADICVWAHIRWIQKNNPQTVITQPCPAIVDYILYHNSELLPYLSPVQSPMMCTAIYMRKYMGINDKIAAISPCIAKSNEFEETGNLVSYNITFVKLEEYIKRNGLDLPADYSQIKPVVPLLGPPLPGDLGRTMLKHQGRLEGEPRNGGDVDAERQRLAAQELKARESQVFFRIDQRRTEAPAGEGAVRPTAAGAPLAPEQGRIAFDLESDQNNQQRKQDVLKEKDIEGIYNPHTRKHSCRPIRSWPEA